MDAKETPILGEPTDEVVLAIIGSQKVFKDEGKYPGFLDSLTIVGHLYFQFCRPSFNRHFEKRKTTETEYHCSIPELESILNSVWLA